MGASAILVAVTALSTLIPTAGGRIVAEWSPGIPEPGLGGELVVDTYGIGGLGAYRVAFDDGTTHLAVCVQADIGHSLSAVYVADPAAELPAELGYLAWAYLAGATATDIEAAAVNLLAWRYTAAQRSTGGPVWQGDEVEVRVLGVGRLLHVEEAAARLHAEATARRGPWSFADAVVAGDTVSVRVVGPGGPIAGVRVQFDDIVVTTGADGSAATTIPTGATGVSVRASGPGAAVALAAAGSQRLAMAGPSTELTTTLFVPPTTTTTTTITTTSTTTTSTTSTTVPATTTSTTTAPTTTPSTSTTTTTAPPITTTTTTITAPPSTSPSPTTQPVPPTLPATGSPARGVTRIGAALFAAGAVAVLCSTRVRPRPAAGARPRPWSR